MNNSATRLKHRLTLQEPVETADEGGGTTRAWQDVADLWGEIRAVSGKEQIAGHQQESSGIYRIMVRARGDITHAMRFVHEARHFNIRAVLAPIAQPGMMEVIVEEGMAV